MKKYTWSNCVDFDQFIFKLVNSSGMSSEEYVELSKLFGIQKLEEHYAKGKKKHDEQVRKAGTVIGRDD